MRTASGVIYKQMLNILQIVIFIFLLLPSLSNAAMPTVAGRILTDAGPLSGGRLFAYRSYADIESGAPLFVSVPADLQGSYSTQLPAGEYYFVARGTRDGRKFFAYHGNNPIKVDIGNNWITLLAVVEKQPVFSEETAALKGVVTYKGQPVKGAYVTLYKPGSKRFKGLGFRTESTAVDGSFNIPVTDGKYVVVAKMIESGKGNRPLKPGDLYCYYPNNPVEVRGDSSTTIEVPCYPKDDRASFLKTPAIRPKNFKTIVNLTSAATNGIKGRVTDSNGKPLPGILVLAYRATKPVFLTYHLSHGTEYSAETAADGSYFIPVDVSGDYYLVARDTLGDGPHRGELYGLYNGNSRHVVAFEQGKQVDNINITAGRIMDEPKVHRPALSADSVSSTSDQEGGSGVRQSAVTDQVIAVDTVWKGHVTIKGVVVVKKGVTLTITPGTVVAFSRIDRDNNGVGDGELRIEGRVIARGTAARRIVFTSAETIPETRDWSYIHLLASQADNLFESCRFEYGFSGMQVHYSNVRINNCVFSHDHEGLHFNTANVVADHNTFVNNGTAIRFKRLEGNIIVSNNNIHDNEIGVLFGRQQINAVDFKSLNKPVEFPSFVNNNIFKNKKYNFSMGEGQNLDIDLKDNWWGTAITQQIEDSIFDKNSDAALGRVSFTPFLKMPMPGAGNATGGDEK